jgi:phosphoenolpyruvate carboxykinase (ATP)
MWVEKFQTKNLKLDNYGITDLNQIFYNLSYDELYHHELNPHLEGFEKGYVTNLGAITVDTGAFQEQ